MYKNRIDLENDEAQILAPYAMLSRDSAGREHDEPIAETRTCFQRDRDRIMHSKAFRRETGKSQVVFTPSSGDHYRNRITHTLEVAQIARSIAKNLGLNADLAEAIALGHDLGHTPNGHAGEDMLNEIMVILTLNPKDEEEKLEMIKKKMGFEHNRQSLCIVKEIGHISDDFPGFNPTMETSDGLMKHRGTYDKGVAEKPITLEAVVVDLADAIAYTAHDTDDGLRDDKITIEQLREHKLWKDAEALAPDSFDQVTYVQTTVKKLISIMIKDVCEETNKRLDELEIKLGRKIESNLDVRPYTDELVAHSAEMEGQMSSYKEMLFKKFYMHPDIVNPHIAGKQRILDLFVYYIHNTTKLPDEYQRRLEKDNDFKNTIIVIKDYIAGMTDQYAFDRWYDIPANNRNKSINVLNEMSKL